jgi:hypothetical protein
MTDNWNLPCSCGANPGGACNISVCRQPWARKYRKDVQPDLLDRIVGFFAAMAWWR